MKKLLVFCIALNLSLIAGLSLVFYLGRSEKKKLEEENIGIENSYKEESLDMLRKAGEFYADKKYLDTRVRLKMAAYRIFDADSEENSKLISMGDWYFFESGEISNENEEDRVEFFTFIGAVRALISETEMSESEAETVEKIRIFHANSVFSHSVYPSLTAKAEVSEEYARKKSMSLLGEKVVLSAEENTLFPICYTFSGKNTFASVSVLGGRLIKLYFYPGTSEYDISEDEALSIMYTFMAREQIREMEAETLTKENGLYYACFRSNENKDAKILIAVKGSGGRVCLFDAGEFYKHYKS